MRRTGLNTKYSSARIVQTKGAEHRRGALWRALRILRRFTVFELMAVAEQDNKHSVLTFLGQLRKAGFLRAQAGNRGRHEPTTFFLIRDPGPACPAVLKRGMVVYDRNTDTEYPINGAP